jgi:predicted ArsR family transcriptional regulator
VPVTVADAAEVFGLHPNVARMHLGKLERAGLLVTSLRRAAGGGRPARLYQLSDAHVSLDIPPRRYELLSALALSVLSETADEAEVLAACKRAGAATARKTIAAEPQLDVSDRVALAQLVQRLAEESGLIPAIEWNDRELVIDVRNCIFRELSTANPDQVCAMHRAFFEGLAETLAGDAPGARLSGSDSSISRGSDRCRLTLTFE